MTPEERSMLINTAALVEENNKLLKSMRRSARWQSTFQIIYWVLIIGLTFGAFYFIQPYINSLSGSLGALGNLSSGQTSSQSVDDKGQSITQELQNALKQYQTQ